MTKQMHILLVDDDREDIDLTMEILKEKAMNLKVTVALNGQEASDFLCHTARSCNGSLPNVILLDLNMPGKNGLEVLRDIKNNVHLKHIPVIIFTSSKSQSDIEQSYANGANCFISKPIGLSELKDTLDIIDKFWFQTVRY